MNNFKRENRYVVFKRQNLSHAQGKVLHSIESELCPDGNVKECLVVEHDWPCYDAAWNMIVKLSAGKFSDPYAEIKQLRERVKELEKELKESEDDLDAAEQQLSSYENALEEVQAVFVDRDACPLFEPFNPRNLSAWLNKFAIAKKVEALDEVESVYMQAAETSEPISFREAFDAVEEQLRKERE